MLGNEKVVGNVEGKGGLVFYVIVIQASNHSVVDHEQLYFWVRELEFEIDGKRYSAKQNTPGFSNKQPDLGPVIY